MSDFQPLGCGLGRPTFQPATDDATPADIEQTTMTKNPESIGDAIVRLITGAGGSISSADLQHGMPDVASPNRLYHTRKLVEAGRITTKGATSNRTYHLAGESKPSVKSSKPGKAKEQALALLFADRVARQQLIDTTAYGAPVMLQVATEATLIEDLPPILRQHLRRVLALALSRPGDIHDADRQALAAVAEGC